MNRVLFIGHDASRSGAPIVLLNLLAWLRRSRPELLIDVLLLRGGELEAEFRAHAEVQVVPDESRSLAGRLSQRVGIRSDRRTPGINAFRRNYDLVFGNTIVTLEYLASFQNRGARTVCWIHELDYVIDSFFTRQSFLELSSGVDHFVCGSEAVKVNLAARGVERPCSVVYEPGPLLETPKGDPAEVKRELGIPGDAFVVGGGGTVEWRKGTDLFLQIAAEVVRHRPSVRFLWVGGASDRPVSEEMRRVLHDRAGLKLKDKVIFTGVTSDPARYLSVADIFALTSREDPFPIMCTQAAGLGKPVMCFADVGGMPEFVGPDAGAVVPYGDLDAFAEGILHFYDDRASLIAAAGAAEAKARGEFAPDRSLESLEAILLNQLRSHQGG